MSGAVRRTAGYTCEIIDCYWQVRQTALLLNIGEKYRAFSDRLHCADAFRLDGRNSSFTTKICAYTSIAFLVGVISYSVDSTLHVKPVYLAQCFGATLQLRITEDRRF